MDRNDCIRQLTFYSETLRKEFGISSLRLFGSLTRNQQRTNSDIDLYMETVSPNPFVLADAKEFLEQHIGYPVDIVRNHKRLNPRLKHRIENEGITIF